MWAGSAAVCINQQKQILMVKQGQVHEPKRWSVPSGGKEEWESFEECCVREVYEETGYHIKIIKPIQIKEGTVDGERIQVHYFLAEIIGGSPVIQDPDQLIYEISWKSASEVKQLDLSFPSDREFLLDLL